jgi:plastocyanin
MNKRRLASLASLVLILGSCSGGDAKSTKSSDAATAAGNDVLQSTSTTTATEPPADAAPAGPDFTVTATEYAFDAPRVVTGGIVNLTFKNAGKQRHEALIVKVGDTPKATVIADLDKFVNTKGQPIAGYLDFNGGVGTLNKGTETKTSLTLPAGKYAIVCTLTDFDSIAGSPIPQGANAPELYTKGMYAPLTVKGDDGGALPPGDGVIVATDYAFKLPAFTAGPHTYVFRNDGPSQPHFAAIGEFPAGVDAATGRKALEALFQATPEAPPPAGTPEPADLAFAEPLAPKAAGTFQVTLQAGRTYSVTCFLSDRQGGQPHALSKGMFTVFTVPG